jgi:hypothetical protein
MYNKGLEFEMLKNDIIIESIKDVINVDSIVNEFMDVSQQQDVKQVVKIARIRKKTIDKMAINYENFIKFQLNLKTYTLPELKYAAKSHRLLISGTKPLLIARLEVLFKNIKNAIIIQRFFRGWVVRYSFKLRGPALNNRQICLNDTDFITLEPLSEIEHSNFYSYKDSKDFVYGFNIVSLMQSMKTKSKLENPYNRERINNNIMEQIKTLFKLSCIINIDFREENESLISPTNIINRRTRTIPQNTTTTVPNTPTTLTSIHARNVVVNQESVELLRRLSTMRAKPASERINDLFMEIDALGNYTSSTWFSSLDSRQYIRLYRTLYEIWNYRSNLSREVKNRICPVAEPFYGIFPNGVYYNDLTMTQIQSACLTVFENMVFQGIDEDHRRIGTFHALSGLTLVSDGARQAMPWLYDSVAY